MLRSKFFTAEQVETLTSDFRNAGLDSTDEAIAAFAEKVVLHANEITQADIDLLRTLGLDDAEIFDIVLAAAARVFWSRANDVIGFEPSESFLDRVQSLFGERLFRALMVGRRYGSARNE